MNKLSEKGIQTLHASLNSFIAEYLTEETYDGQTLLIDYLRHQLTGAEFASAAFPQTIQLESTLAVFKQVSEKIAEKAKK